MVCITHTQKALKKEDTVDKRFWNKVKAISQITGEKKLFKKVARKMCTYLKHILFTMANKNI